MEIDILLSKYLLIEISIKNLSILIQQIIQYEGELAFDKEMPDGNPRKLLNSSKINNFGWSSKIKLNEGIYLGTKQTIQKNNHILISENLVPEKKIKWMFRLIK